MVYNILPGGDTILHKLFNNGEIITQIFQIAHPNPDKIMQMKFHVPFIKNLEHESPMHKCKQKQDIRSLNNMLKYLSGYGIDHHSRAITDLMPFIVEKSLPYLIEYLRSRMQ